MYTLIVTLDGQSMIKKTIRELVAELDGQMFWQIHRSAVVNVNAIAAVHRAASGTLQVRLKQHRQNLTVSTPGAHLFRQM